MIGERCFFIFASLSLASSARIDHSRYASVAGRTNKFENRSMGEVEKSAHEHPLWKWLKNQTAGWRSPTYKCGLSAASVTHAGEVWKADVEGTFRPSQLEAADHCTGSGFRSIQHGDGLNEVDFLEEQRFVYVPGNNPGTGAGITICDLGQKPVSLEYVFTDGLSGCMGLSIVGTRKESKHRDMFFCHSRTWSSFLRGQDIPLTDPLYNAREFVQTHEDLHIFYGSGVHDVNDGIHHNYQSEARLLSSILGVWVMPDHYHAFPLQSQLAFHTDLEAWVPLTGKEEEKIRSFNEAERKQGLVSPFTTPQWRPRPEIVEKLAQSNVREELLETCTETLRAYVAGTYDGLGGLLSIAHKKGKLASEMVNLAKEDMEKRGYGQKQQHERLQIDLDRNKGRHYVATPKAPAQT